MKKQITAVFGLPVNKEKQFLLTQRNEPKDPRTHHKWQIAGGGVEFGEQPEETLIRELQEEIEVTPTLLYPYPLVKTAIHNYPTRQFHITLICYLVTIGDQIPTVENEETADARWFTLPEVQTLDTLDQVKEFVTDWQQLLKT